MSKQRVKRFIHFSIVWVACNLSIPFWVIGHVHLSLNIYHDIIEIVSSFGMNLIVGLGFWLNWRDESKKYKKKEIDMLSKILERYPDEEFIVADGFDNAIIGVSSDYKLVYSIEKIIEILVSRNNWTHEDAADYFFFNIEGSYVGEQTPIFINLVND